MIRLAIFDLDGTTVNSLSAIAHYANETLKAFGFPPFPEDAYRTLAGGGSKKLIGNILRALGLSEEADRQGELFSTMHTHWVTAYDRDFLRGTTAFEGVPEMLAALKKNGVHTAILTNKHGPTAEKIVTTLFGKAGSDGGLVEKLVSAYPEMVLKPAPDEIYRLCAHFGVSAEECLYCGDHTIDIVTGKNADVFTVGVTWGFHSESDLLAAGADFIAHRPSDILAALGE